MRLKNVPAARDAIAQSDICIKDPERLKGKWKSEIFRNDHPLHIEIGMGKGRFIMELAATYPDINFIGIEMYSSVIYRGIQKYEATEDPPKNLVFLCFDATEICDIFEKGEVDRIYLNFSDPWPKDRHAKRRLTSDRFLKKYDLILAWDGHVEFKTDNRDLFDFSIASVKENGWEIAALTYDLHNDEAMNRGNIMTEYEEKFSKMGNPIYKMIISRSAGDGDQAVTVL